MSSNRRGDGKRFRVLELFVAPTITGLVTGLAVSVFLLVFGPVIADRWEVRRPTCEDPRGVLQVDAEGLLTKQQLSLEVSSTQEPIWTGDNLVDGITETVWVPRDDQVQGAWVKFTFSAPQDLQLICIVNGVASSSIAYLRADRIRAARVKTEPTGKDSGPVSPVKSLGEFEFQNRQPLEFDKGITKSVQITIEGIYNGVTVYEPKGDRIEELPRTRHTALAEVEFYMRDPAAP